MTSIIDELSAPNHKLIALTRLHRDVSDLMDLQRIEVMGDKSEPSEMFLRETSKVESGLDTLRMLFESQPAQLKRIGSIDSLMSLRNRLFLKYLKVRYNYVKKGVLDKQLAALSSQIDKENLQVDSNVVTTEKSVKTTTIIPAEPQNAPKKKRWFSKKQKEDPKPSNPQVIIEEKTDVKVDTLSVASRDSILTRIENSISGIETDRKQSRQHVREREMALIQTNDLLIDELLNVIREVESQEIAEVKAKNKETVQLADQTISFMRTITVVFALVALILAALIISDISRSNRYRNELEIAKAEAEYHSIAKQRFLANMSHEIRTPLQSIIGYSEQLSQQSQDESASAIAGSAKHLLQVVNEILDYSRIISGKFTIEKEIFNLKFVADEVFRTVEMQARLRNFTITKSFPEEEIILFGDAFRLRQILYNLLGNALKFTTDNVSLKIAAQRRRDGRFRIDFAVEDNGAGMRKEDLARIFNQFEQAGSENARSGTGLGLSIVKELVEAQGGKISVESEPGKGSGFSFYIEYETAEAQILGTDAEIIPVSFKGKVWIVDDDQLILKLCKIIFEKHGIQHLCFDSAEKMLAADWDPEVRLVFADVRLPGISGTELATELRERNIQVPVVALTAQVLPEEKEDLLQNGYNDLLLKPFVENQLLAKLGLYSGQEPENPGSFSELRKMIPDPEELEAIVQQFRLDTASDLEELNSSLAENNAPQTVLLIHRIAGRLGQMGEKESAATWREMEMKLRRQKDLPKAEISEMIKVLTSSL